MRRWLLACAALGLGIAHAQSSNWKAGLWEIKPISRVMDGQDQNSQVAAAQARQQQMLANMKPEQRKQMEAMMQKLGNSGMGSGGTTRVCVSAAMAAQNSPLADHDGHCTPPKVNRSGDQATFEFNCSSNGRTTVGTGRATFAKDLVTTKVDMTITDSRGKHTVQSETQMKYLGADCQGVKPMDAVVKGARNGAG